MLYFQIYVIKFNRRVCTDQVIGGQCIYMFLRIGNIVLKSYVWNIAPRARLCPWMAQIKPACASAVHVLYVE